MRVGGGGGRRHFPDCRPHPPQRAGRQLNQERNLFPPRHSTCRNRATAWSCGRAVAKYAVGRSASLRPSPLPSATRHRRRRFCPAGTCRARTNTSPPRRREMPGCPASMATSAIPRRIRMDRDAGGFHVVHVNAVSARASEAFGVTPNVTSRSVGRGQGMARTVRGRGD